jgi:hypothetical protein
VFLPPFHRGDHHQSQSAPLRSPRMFQPGTPASPLMLNNTLGVGIA